MPTEPLLQFFEYVHLPPHLADVSRPFGELAKTIVSDLPCNDERTEALRKLLEAKDCAVRASLMKPEETAPTSPTGHRPRSCKHTTMPGLCEDCRRKYAIEGVR